MARLRLSLALAAVALLLCYPQTALVAALEAMTNWATTFAPALFPFFAVVPALSCKEALKLYEKCFGRALPFLFGCPGRAAGAIAVGCLAGSPAGTIALRYALSEGGMTRAEAVRAALLSAGLSPMFLLGAVGAGLLGDPGAGWILLRGQLLGVLLSGCILRNAFCGGEAAAPTAPLSVPAEAAQPVREAVLAILTVCGWMALFAVAAAILNKLFSVSPIAVLEAAGGCVWVARQAWPAAVKLAALGFVCGFGGLSVFGQNVSQLKGAGLRWQSLLLGKLLHGGLTAIFCSAQAALGANGTAEAADAWLYACLAALVLVAALALSLRLAKRTRPLSSRA